MQESVDVREFMRVTVPAIQAGDVAGLAEAVQGRWRPKDLCVLLRHAEVDVRKVAAVTLGLVGDKSVVGCLAKALHDCDEQVNQMAEHGLWAIWFRSGSPQATAHFRHGVQYLTAESYEQAIGCFETAHRIDPTFAEAFNQCAIAHFFLCDWSAAIDDCRRTIELMPVHFGAISGMGHCYTQSGELSRARDCYRKALQINPRMPAIERMLDRIARNERDDNNSSGIFSSYDRIQS